MSLGVVALIDRLLEDTFGIDAASVRTCEVLTKNSEPGVVFRFDAHGVSHFWAYGEMRPNGDPAEEPVPAIYLEAGLVMMPKDWAAILNLTSIRFPTAGGSMLAILNDGEILGLDLLLPSMNYSRNEIETKITDFLKSIEPTRIEIMGLYPDLQPVACRHN